jgi:hypothetical protein
LPGPGELTWRVFLMELMLLLARLRCVCKHGFAAVISLVSELPNPRIGAAVGDTIATRRNGCTHAFG